IAPNGELDLTQRAEPVAADGRAIGDGMRRARLKLLAGLLGIGFGEFWPRHLRQQRERAAWITGVTVVILLTICLSLLKWRQAQIDADAHERAAIIARAEERQLRQ